MKKFNAPNLRNDFMIVVHNEKHDLAAVALSYLFQNDCYLPVFTFRKVEIALDSEILNPDIYNIQRRNANVFSIFLSNAILENGGVENLVLLGLTEEQKSYIPFIAHYNVLDIEDHQDLEQYLGAYGYGKNEALECSTEQCVQGFYQALKENRVLKIGSANYNLTAPSIDLEGGIIIIESARSTDVIMSINYGFSIGANIFFVEKILEEEEQEVLYLIERWEAKDPYALDEIKEKVNIRVGAINFQLYDYATFFTEGLPYSLCISDIPVSQVNLIYRPDFFIFNAFIYEKSGGSGSAVVFSPQFWEDEETINLISLLEFENFYLRILLNKGASSYNIKNTVENYPFDLLHICSHGGDIDGINCIVKFRDNKGVKHKVEFNHVFNMAVTPFVDLHTVESMYYFTAIDGEAWRSNELKAKNYTREFYASLTGIISKAFADKKVIRRQKVARVPNANAIKCNVFNYLGNFEQTGGDSIHPVIFNNSCGSWMNISSSFLVSGARGYIGTLRRVENTKAMRFAKVFYENLFETNIINAVYEGTKDYKKIDPNPIYILWGLHFSTLKNRNPVDFNRTEVLNHLMEGMLHWQEHPENIEGSRNLVTGRYRDIKWILNNVFSGERTMHFPD